MIGTESLCRATQHAQAIHGHAGYEDGVISRAVADALGTRIAGGTLEAQKKTIFQHLLRRLGPGDSSEGGVSRPRGDRGEAA